MCVCNSVAAAAAAAGLVNVIALMMDCHARQRQRQKKIIMSWEMNHMQVAKARRRLSSKTRYLRRSPRPRGKRRECGTGTKAADLSRIKNIPL